MGKHVFWFGVFAVIFGVVAGYQLLHFGDFDTSIISEPPTGKVTLAGIPLNVYVADTPQEQERGLSGRDGLAENEGMLFVFPKDEKHTFWMKDMKFSIDIIWIAADGKVVSIARNVSPDTYPRTFKPSEPARFVLEVNAGFVERHNIQVGNIVYSN